MEVVIAEADIIDNCKACPYTVKDSVAWYSDGLSPCLFCERTLVPTHIKMKISSELESGRKSFVQRYCHRTRRRMLLFSWQLGAVHV